MQHRTLRPLLLAIAISSLSVQVTWAAELHFRAECRCESALVRVGDIADVLAGDTKLAKQLADVELFPAPAPGRSRVVRIREIQELLALRFEQFSRLRLSGASRIRVYGPPNLSKTSSRARPVGATETGDPSLDSQVARIPVKVWEDGAPEDGPPDDGLVVVARRSLRRGEILREADVQLMPWPERTRQSRSDAVLQVSDVVGLETVRAVPSGQIIESGYVRTPVLVHRGEVVTVYARSTGVQVRTSARAIDQGSEGQVVTVESLLDRSRFSAVVVGFQEVEVHAGRIAGQTTKNRTP